MVIPLWDDSPLKLPKLPLVTYIPQWFVIRPVVRIEASRCSAPGS